MPNKPKHSHSFQCHDCLRYDQCPWHKREDIHKERFDTISDFLTLVMKYRDRGYYSFRGQREMNWLLGVSHRFSDPRGAHKATNLISHFRRRSMALPQMAHLQDSDEWRWLFLAQHHGLKTKLLDWTTNPLVALYFAVENIVSQKTDEVLGAVWGVKVQSPFFLSPSHDVRPSPSSEIEPHHPPESDWYFVNPAPISARIERQSGKFTFHPDTTKNVTDKETNPARGRQLVLFCMGPHSDVADRNRTTRRHLGVTNIHHASMFPDHTGIAQFLNEEFLSLEPFEEMEAKNRVEATSDSLHDPVVPNT
jgi:hypothetical protein